VWSAVDKQTKLFRGELALLVGTDAQGYQGFGYDPIMHLAGHAFSAQSIAMLPAAFKNSMSHRRLALSEWFSSAPRFQSINPHQSKGLDN